MENFKLLKLILSDHIAFKKFANIRRNSQIFTTIWHIFVSRYGPVIFYAKNSIRFEIRNNVQMEIVWI